jgi:hypothetical protein
MPQLDLRPLSLGEILDRTFSLYRRHFFLFAGIALVPQLLTLAFNLARVLTVTRPGRIGRVGDTNGFMAFGLSGLIIWVLVAIITYLFAHGGTVYAVSELYLGRPTTIGASLRRMWGQLLNLLGVTILNGLAIGVALLLLIVPGIYLACRLLTCVPSALIEDLGARESLERSYSLTKDNAGRAFVICFLYATILYAVVFLFAVPLGVGLMAFRSNPEMSRLMLLLMQVGNFFAGVVVGPFFLIATTVFYYDLRVRKEAFDLQLMMDPTGNVPASGSRVPSMLA